MNIQEIVREWLQAHGYDGLVDEYYECACDIADLMPCGNPMPRCTAGHKEPCNDVCGEGHQYHIVPGKRP